MKEGRKLANGTTTMAPSDSIARERLIFGVTTMTDAIKTSIDGGGGGGRSGGRTGRGRGGHGRGRGGRGRGGRGGRVSRGGSRNNDKEEVAPTTSMASAGVAEELPTTDTSVILQKDDSVKQPLLLNKKSSLRRRKGDGGTTNNRGDTSVATQNHADAKNQQQHRGSTKQKKKNVRVAAAAAVVETKEESKVSHLSASATPFQMGNNHLQDQTISSPQPLPLFKHGPPSWEPQPSQQEALHKKDDDDESNYDNIHSNEKSSYKKDPKRKGKTNKQQTAATTTSDNDIYKMNPKISARNNNNKGKKEGGKGDTHKAVSSPHVPLIPPNQPQTTNDLNYGRGERITVLHVAEKPSIALAIAKGLCPNDGQREQVGRLLPVHEFSTSSLSSSEPFPKAPHASKCLHRVTSVAGHVFSVDFPPQFQSWDSVDPAELFTAPIVKKPNKGSMIKHLQDQARGVHFIVLWMDCDREGENINFEVLDCCMHLMVQGGSGGGSAFDRVYRAHFSAINPSDIVKAYHALGKPDKNQSLAVDARQELDLKVGVAFSRFQTRFFQGRYGDLDSAVLSYGPCQTPTLGFCVKRHLEMETFKPEPYWVLDLGVRKGGRMCRAIWASGRSFHQPKVQGLMTRCMEATDPPASVLVNSVVIKEKKQGRPIPLNTVALLKACSKALGISPHSALKNAERLYLSGYLSYPRTESSTYPKSFDIVGTLQSQANDHRWGNYVSRLLREGTHTKSRGGVDMGDHPPITPCRSAGAHELSGDMARVYDLVVRHFIASVSPDAVWRVTRVQLEIETLGKEGHFTISGKKLESKGFLEILLHKEYGDEGPKHIDGVRPSGKEEEDEEERDLPEFIEGEVIYIASTTTAASSKVDVVPGAGVSRATLDVQERMTTRPTHLSESELIGEMEKYGIGTDASISTHIENILKRNYAELISGRKMCPSKLGLVLAQGYHSIDSSLVLPQIRSDIEDQCNKIAKGLANKDDVIKRAIEIFQGKFDYFVKNVNKMDVLFGSSFAKLQDVGTPFTRCGISRRYLQFIQGPPPRLYNKFTETVYPLPAGGVLKQWTGRKCSAPGCKFELCLYSVGSPPRTFPLCPYCYNNPKKEWGKIPGEDPENSEVPDNAVDRDDEAKERQIRRIGGTSLILECPHPDGHPLIREMTVSPDPDSTNGEGVFILDPHFGPKWRLVSTREPTILHFPKSVEKVTILERVDDVLTICHLMQVEFKGNESPLTNGDGKYVCCFPIDTQMQSLVRVFHGSERLKATGRGGRGRGRGGRKGRGDGDR